jgi:protein-S-isoprenylcysteine O-methyltransferase Ste14
VLITRLILKSTVWLIIMGLLLLMPAGTWRWPQAWAFLGIFAAGSIALSVWLLRRDPGLLASRLGPLVQRGQPLWDKIFLIVFVIIWCAWLVLMALDAEAWRTSDIPSTVNAVGGLLVVFGFVATGFVFRANSFAAPVVRVQAERKQRVIETGECPSC